MTVIATAVMPAPYIGTPQTNDASILTAGLDRIGEMSPEKSFFAPAQKQDLITQMKNARGQSGVNLRTPRAGTRDPLRLLPNGNQGKSEFTPMMKSVTKNNIARRLSSRKSVGLETPAALKRTYINGMTPVLPRGEDGSHLQSENTSSSAGNANDYTPMPHNISSSAQSTPLAQLPNRDNGKVVNDGNVMTLREQENVIDKIEKENFGLKMKIHFLEEAISKRGGDFNQAALKENTDLKVNRITMQRDLHKFKKHISQAERDAETYRLQLEQYKDRIRQKQVDETMRVEMESLRSELKVKETEVKGLQQQQESVQSEESAQIRQLRDDIEDLRADVRDKDRQLENKDDEIDTLKANASKESNASADLEEELESARQETDDVREEIEKAKQEAKDAKEDREDALMAKRKAEDNLDELQEEMANKSFSTKGLSRQVEEKVDKLEEDLEALQERYEQSQSELEHSSRTEKELQERLRHLEKEGTSDARKTQHDLETTRQQRDTFERKLHHMAKQAEDLEKELHVKSDEKNLLQTRHDALTTESAQLQKDVHRARKSIQELESALDEERHKSAQQDNLLRSQHQHEVELFNEQIDSLHRDVNQKENDHAADIEEWEAKRRELESASGRAENKANGLQRTVDKLQDAQGTLSGRDMRLQEALESEKQRHTHEEKVLSKQIAELNDDLAAKRIAAETSRTELNNAREELRISIREQHALKEKANELEEEIEVLQADMEQEHELLEQYQKKSSEGTDGQVPRLKKEKQTLQDNLANAQIELQNVRRELAAAEADREEVEVKLERAHKSADDTFNVDQEKRELRRQKPKLEKEIDRLTSEREHLFKANQELEEEINAEIERASAEENRLNAEVDRLQNKQSTTFEARDRELNSAKNKASRLEAKVKDLEDQLDSHSKAFALPDVDVSGLRDDLEEARQKEVAATKRETDLKSSNRELKMQVNDLERDLHEARLTQLKSRSPSAPPTQSKEVIQLRQELFSTKAELKQAQSQIRDLKRSTRRHASEDSGKGDVQTQLLASANEAFILNDRLADQEEVIESLRNQLQDLQSSNREAREITFDLQAPERQIRDLRSQLRASHSARPQIDEADLSLHLASRDKEVREMKTQLSRIRSERKTATEKADAIESELEIIQHRYENMLEQLSTGKHSKDSIREKEVRGLMKEIMWLKARCRREERLRQDLMVQKRYLEEGEGMRVQCNQIDLRMLKEMGVDIPRSKFETKLKPKEKFRAGVYAVIAAMRLSVLEEDARSVKRLGQSLKVGMNTKVSRPRIREV